MSAVERLSPEERQRVYQAALEQLKADQEQAKRDALR